MSARDRLAQASMEGYFANGGNRAFSLQGFGPAARFGSSRGGEWLPMTDTIE